MQQISVATTSLHTWAKVENQNIIVYGFSSNSNVLKKSLSIQINKNIR